MLYVSCNHQSRSKQLCGLQDMGEAFQMAREIGGLLLLPSCRNFAGATLSTIRDQNKLHSSLTNVDSTALYITLTIMQKKLSKAILHDCK